MASWPLQIVTRWQPKWPSMTSERVPLESTPISQPRTIDPTEGSAALRRGPMALVRDEVGMPAKLQQGDRGTQTLFFDRYERDARRVLLRILGASPDVADAMQETFLRALRSVSQVKDALALRSWLRRIAVTVAFDQLRSRQQLRWLVFPNDAVVELTSQRNRCRLRS